MKCPGCQHESPAGMKFCGQCAAPLMAACAACGAVNPPGNRFCGQCAAPLSPDSQAKLAGPDSYTPKHLAEKILTSKAALAGERKQVTVLFADLKGSMQIERLAHHALRGEVREKAVHYLRQAGPKAAARSALPDARGWFEQALGILEALHESQSTLEQGFEIRLELRSDRNEPPDPSWPSYHRGRRRRARGGAGGGAPVDAIRLRAVRGGQ